jgi:hypothetical protein
MLVCERDAGKDGLMKMSFVVDVVIELLIELEVPGRSLS